MVMYGSNQMLQKIVFENKMKKMKDEEPMAYSFMTRPCLLPHVWSRSHFDHVLISNHNTNNQTASLNKWIIRTMNKQLVYTVSKIQYMMIKIMYDGREETGIQLMLCLGQKRLFRNARMR